MFVGEPMGNFSDSANCLSSSRKTLCKTLNFVLTGIFSHEFFWIDSITLQDSSLPHVTETHLEIEMVPESVKSLKLYCQNSCTIQGTLQILVRKFSLDFTFYVEGFHFEDATLIFNNINVCFKNVTFSNTTIKDKQSAKGGPFSETNLAFSEVHFLNKPSRFGTQNMNKLEMIYSFSAQIQVKDSVSESCQIIAKVNYAQIVMQRDTLRKTSLHVESKSVAFLTFKSSVLHQISSGMHLSSSKILCEFQDSNIIDTEGGLLVKKANSGFVPSWVSVRIHNCTFQNNTRKGSGGALSIQLDSHGNSQCQVSVTNSAFIRNQALLSGHTMSYGGAIAFVIETESRKDKVIFNAEIENCSFQNNRASLAGGSLFLSQGTQSSLTLSDNLFTVDEEQFISPEATFILVRANVFLLSNSFEFEVTSPTKSFLLLDTRGERSQISEIDISISCPPWHKLYFADRFGSSAFEANPALEYFEVNCKPCADTFYSASEGRFQVSFHPNSSKVYVAHSVSLLQFERLPCVNCPFGADCQKGTLKAKPNYWGYKAEDSVIFTLCPLEYCCAGSVENPCLSFDSCSPNRRGVMCGSCEEGHSLSVFSNNCVSNTQCDRSLWWFVSTFTLVMTLYMLWYTFKDDVMGVPVNLVHRIFKVRIREPTKQPRCYFGILTFYVQAAAMLTLNLKVVDQGYDQVLTILENINLSLAFLLTVEVSSVYVDVCVHESFTTMWKSGLNFIFFVGIHFSWFIFFAACVLLDKYCNTTDHKIKIKTLKTKFLAGLCEIIKYSYGGYSTLCFMTITCEFMSNSRVWFYDGSVTCYSLWQKLMLGFCACYVLPFPIMLLLGIKMLSLNAISYVGFLIGCNFPLVAVVVWAIQLRKQSREIHVSAFKKQQDNLATNQMILQCFQGGYLESGQAQYWESVMIFRRLLLAATALMSNSLVQSCCCCALCILFLLHHAYVQPFKNKNSNQVETFSNLLLCFVALMNFLKSFYLQSGIIPEGFCIRIITLYNMFENIGLLLVILFIVGVEVVNRKKMLCRKVKQ